MLNAQGLTSEFSTVTRYSHSFLLGFASRRKEDTSPTREMPCDLCLPPCLLAGQECGTTHVPPQAGAAGWQKTSRDTVSRTSTGSKGALSGSVPAGGTPDTCGHTDTAPTVAPSWPVLWPAGSTRCLSSSEALATVTDGTGASGYAATSRGKTDALFIPSVQTKRAMDAQGSRNVH